MQVTDEMVERAANALAEAEATHDRKEPWISHAARCALTAALSEKQAVEPVAWMIDLGDGETKITDNDIVRDRWHQTGRRVTNLYPAPPLSREGEDSAEVERLTRPIFGIERRTAQEVFDIMADRFRLAATRSGSATTATGGAL